MITSSLSMQQLTTATLVDFHQRLWRKSSNAEGVRLGLARWLTFFYGALVIGLAFVVGRLGLILEASTTIIGMVGGPLLGVFLLAILVKRANTVGTVIGWLAGVVALVPVCFFKASFLWAKTSFMWYGLIGCTATVLVGWLASALFSLVSPTLARHSGPN